MTGVKGTGMMGQHAMTFRKARELRLVVGKGNEVSGGVARKAPQLSAAKGQRDQEREIRTC